jgi:hypothetical protein
MSGERIRIDLIRSRKPRQKNRRSKSGEAPKQTKESKCQLQPYQLTA